jgi:hypothetical protein
VDTHTHRKREGGGGERENECIPFSEILLAYAIVSGFVYGITQLFLKQNLDISNFENFFSDTVCALN